MAQRSASSADRLAREIAHGEAISPDPEAAWNWSSPTGRRRALRRAAFFNGALDATPGFRALELGCGSGVFLERAVATRAAIVGLDLSLTLLKQARARPSIRDGGVLVCGDAERLPFPDGAFDVVYGSSVLHHLDLRVVLADLWRVLKPGGRIVFAEPNLLNPHIVATFWLLPRRWTNVSPDEAAFTRFHGKRLLRAAGFVGVSSEPYDFLHPLVPPALIQTAELIGRWLERVPLLRELAGSQLLTAHKP
jgi:SAM-dependent methyltransferase